MMLVRREGVHADTPVEPIASLRRPGPCIEAHETRRRPLSVAVDTNREECLRNQAGRNKEMLPAPLEARPPAPKTGPSAKALPRGPSAVGGPCPPRRLAPRMDSPPGPRAAAGKSTVPRGPAATEGLASSVWMMCVRWRWPEDRLLCWAYLPYCS